MNNTFSFSRLGRLLLKEFQEFYSKLGPSILALLGVYFVYWLISTLFGSAQGPNDRVEIMGIMFFAIMVIAPLKLYGDCNNSKKGMIYAMLPVSITEKFISMMLFCAIITPIISLALFLGLDSLLSLFHFEGGFHPSLFASDVINSKTVESVFTIILFQSGFLLGNLLFKKHKISRTILSMIGLHLVFLVLIIIAIKISGQSDVIISTESSLRSNDVTINSISLGDYQTWIRVLVRLYQFGLPLVFYVLSFFRLKTIKY